MNYSFSKNNFCLKLVGHALVAGLFLFICSQACGVIVTLGCGSYTTTIPTGGSGNDANPAGAYVTGTFNQMVATNKWWEPFIYKMGGNKLGYEMDPLPWEITPLANGVGMCYSTVASAGGNNWTYNQDIL